MSILSLRIGGTNTSAYLVRPEDRQVMPVEFGDGYGLLPTAVGFPPNGQTIVGREALHLRLLDPSAVKVGFVRELVQGVGLEASPLSPSELTSRLVTFVRDAAERTVGTQIKSCVLSIPAFYAVRSIQAICAAVESAGLNVLTVIFDPLAAVLGAGLDEEIRWAAVIRMGGYGFDVAVVRQRSPWELVAMQGDAWLGGNAVDQAVADWYLGTLDPMAAEWMREDPRQSLHLLQSSEKAKRLLSGGTQSTAIIAPQIDRALLEARKISRGEFDNLARPLLEQATAVVYRCLSDVQLEPRDLDAVLLAGGSAPLLREIIEGRYGVRATVVDDQPQLLCAKGAARAAAAMIDTTHGEPPPAESAHVALASVQSDPIFVGLADGGRKCVVPAGARLPFSTSLTFCADRDDMPEIRIPLYEGSHPMGDVVVPLPPGLPAGTRLDLEIRIDETGELETFVDVWARQHYRVAAESSPPHPRGAGQANCVTMPDVVSDLVHFSVTSPPVVARGETCLMDVWAYVGTQRQAALRRAHEEASGRGLQVKSRGPVKVARGNILTVRPHIQDLTIDPPQETILWEGEIGNATFAVTVPEDANLGPHAGSCEFHVNGLRVATMRFLIGVGTEAAQAAPIRCHEARARSAFASYASADRDDVLARVHGMQKAVPQLDVFLDVARLRSGDDWQQRIRQEILQRDVLYLFWSRAAAESHWVEWEWRCGLRLHGVEFIDPVPLVSPDEVPPPSELADRLHFNDWVLAYMSGK